MTHDLESRIERAVTVAAEHADAVHEEGRFPQQAIDALKANRLLGVLVGNQLSLSETARICFRLGEACGSTGLIYAMHQIEVAMLLAERDEFSHAFLKRVDDEQLLLASVTSEEGIGGNIRASLCAVKVAAGASEFDLKKNATTISYGAYADGLLITCRAREDSNSSDQVLVTVTKDQYTLERTSKWNTIGMRGTCSDGFHVDVHAPIHQICSTPFGALCESVMLPVSHMLWSSVWLGIAANATARARSFLREAAKRGQGGQLPPGNTRLVHALEKMQFMHSRIKNALARYEQLQSGNALPQMTIALTTEMNGLKTSVSEMAKDVVDEALMICGIAGFKNGTQWSLGRHLADIHSARLMVSNDRIVGNSASFLVAQRSPVVVF
jgi:acyl-CoA dehydrogenase